MWATGLPECDGETVFIGVNENGYACCFNAIDARGNCVMESPEDYVVLMSGLTHWMRLPPTPDRAVGSHARALAEFCDKCLHWKVPLTTPSKHAKAQG